MSAPAIPDVIADNQARFTASATAVKDNNVNEYAVTPDHRDDAEGVTEFTATEVAGSDFDIEGALWAIANGDAEFKSESPDGQAVLAGMEHAFQAGALFHMLFAEEIEDDPELVKMGFQTYMLSQLALAGRGE